MDKEQWISKNLTYAGKWDNDTAVIPIGIIREYLTHLSESHEKEMKVLKAENEGLRDAIFLFKQDAEQHEQEIEKLKEVLREITKLAGNGSSATLLGWTAAEALLNSGNKKTNTDANG